MKRSNIRKTVIAAALAGAAILGGAAFADPQHGGYAPGMMGGYGMGPGMMGPGMMGGDETVPAPRGYGPGSGMGPGAMGGGYGRGLGYGMPPGAMGGYGPGYGMGPGMMGGMMGPGMMGGYGQGYGMGPGMMGGYGQGYGMGPGMMGGTDYGMLRHLNLSPEQWKKLETIHQDLAKKNWELTGKLREQAVKLHNLTGAEKRDRAAIVNQYKKLQELRLQSFQARIDGHDRVEGVFTKEQKDQLRRFGQRW